MNKRLATALAILLVPLLVAGSLLWGTWNANPRLRQVEAAVVNNDEMVEVNGQMMPLGRQLAAELVNSDREQNFTWVLANEQKAEEGLASGRFAAVVTIPKEFSANATSFAGEADDAQQAQINVQTSPVTGISETVLGQSIADASANALNRFLTKEYLKNIYVGFNEMGEQFVTMRDGTRQLADGSRQLADGTDAAAAGVAQLADGLGQLSANSGKLVSGAQQAADGAGQYVGGVKQLAGGLDQLGGGLGQFSSGVDTYAAGSREFSNGLSDYASGVHDYAAGVKQYTDGVAQFVGPIRDLIAKLAEFVDLLPEFSDWLEELDRLADELPDMIIDFDKRVQDFVTRVKDFLDQLDKIDGSAGELRDGVAGVRSWASAMASGSKTIACPASLADVEGGCDAFHEGVRAGTDAAADKMAPLASQANALEDLLDQIRKHRDEIWAAADRLAKASAKLAAYAPQLREDIETLRGQIPDEFPRSKAELQALVGQIVDGLNQLLAGGEQLAAGGAALAAGGDQLAAGADGLADGASSLAGGAWQLTKGAKDAASGAGLLASEGGKLASGLGDLASGLGQYADGVSQVADGSMKAADGFAALSVGADQLASGVEELADGIADGADAIPSYNPEQRQNLADVVAEPVATEGLDALVAPTVSWASLLFVLALWLGGVAVWVARRAINPTNITSTAGNGRLLWRTLAPGFLLVGLQALLLAGIGGAIIRMPIGVTLGVAGVLALASVAFVSINHALVAWGGAYGRLLSLFFLLVTSVSALAYSSPGVFSSMRSLSPLSPALDAVRAVMTGFSPMVPILLLVAWSLVGLSASALAVMRSRTVRLKDLVRA